MKFQILSAIDFGFLKVDVVLVECAHRADSLASLMRSKGFYLQPRAHSDMVFVHRSALRRLCSFDLTEPRPNDT